MQTQISKDIIEGTRYFIKLVELGSYSAVKNLYAVELVLSQTGGMGTIFPKPAIIRYSYAAIA